jgi:hypothetical protein
MKYKFLWRVTTQKLLNYFRHHTCIYIITEHDTFTIAFYTMLYITRRDAMQSSSTCESHNNRENLSQDLSQMNNSSNCTPNYLLHSFKMQHIYLFFLFCWFIINLISWSSMLQFQIRIQIVRTVITLTHIFVTHEMLWAELESWPVLGSSNPDSAIWQNCVPKSIKFGIWVSSHKRPYRLAYVTM